jgi:hypothetical protein
MARRSLGEAVRIEEIIAADLAEGKRIGVGDIRELVDTARRLRAFVEHPLSAPERRVTHSDPVRTSELGPRVTHCGPCGICWESPPDVQCPRCALVASEGRILFVCERRHVTEVDSDAFDADVEPVCTVCTPPVEQL